MGHCAGQGSCKGSQPGRDMDPSRGSAQTISWRLPRARAISHEVAPPYLGGRGGVGGGLGGGRGGGWGGGWGG